MQQITLYRNYPNWGSSWS